MERTNERTNERTSKVWTSAIASALIASGCVAEPLVDDHDAVRMGLSEDGRPYVVDEPTAYSPDFDPAVLRRVREARRAMETVEAHASGPASSTHWALLAAEEERPLLEQRRRGERVPSDAGIVSFTVVVSQALAHERPADEYRRLTEAEREPFMEGRRTRAAAEHRELLRRLMADPRVHHTEVSWLTEDIHVVADADAVADIAVWPDVERLSPNAPVEPQGAFSGTMSRFVTRAQNLIDAGNRGEPTIGPRVRIAIIDYQGSSYQGWPLRRHAAFAQSGTDSTPRFTVMESCNECTQTIFACVAWGCRPFATPPEPYNQQEDHATTVSFLAGGSIEQGQVPSITASDQRAARSGIASESELWYLGAQDCDAIGRAITRSLTADVVVVTATRPYVAGGIPYCSQAYDCGDLRRVLDASSGGDGSSGPVVLVAAGNTAPGANPCTIEFPAYLPGVAAVGSYDNTTVAPLSYASAPIAARSPSGNASVTYQGALPGARTSQMMGVVAPDVVTLVPDLTRVTTGPYTSVVPADRFSSSARQGTSYAAALVGGGVALQMESFRETFGVQPRGLAATAIALLSADTWQASLGTRGMQLDSRSGMGRYRAISPGTLVGSNWGTRGGWFSTGTYSWTVGSAGPETGVRQWRWVALQAAERMDSIPGDFVIDVIDTCAGNTVVVEDLSFNLRKRLSLDASAICPSGGAACRCLTMRMTVLRAGRFYMADFTHTGTEVL